jgi:uncharacterized SAM-binding protein YcdF (DUF218 family)
MDRTICSRAAIVWSRPGSRQACDSGLTLHFVQLFATNPGFAEVSFMCVLLAPSNVVIAIGLIGAVLLPTRFVRVGRRLVVTSILLIAVIGLSPLGRALLLPLEGRFPRWDPSRGRPTGIVVLGGLIDTAEGRQTSSDRAIKRAIDVAELARRYPSARILFPGGNRGQLSGDLAEAKFAQRLFETFGIPSERISFERDSRTTAESASLTKVLAEPKSGERWLLVTSAVHMPRAMGAFRKVDFSVEAYPVDYQTNGRGDLLSPPGSVAGGLTSTAIATDEWIGLLVYWLTGRSSELFPKPYEAKGQSRSWKEAPVTP